MNKIRKWFDNFLKNLEKTNKEIFDDDEVNYFGLTPRNINYTKKHIHKRKM